MFSLIITIISIALVAALAVATIYYGGSAFTAGSAKAQLATAVSQAQQIAGAVTLAVSDGNVTVPTATALVSTLTALTGGTTNYLTTIPTAPGGGAWSIGPNAGGQFALTTTVPASVCTAYNNNPNLQNTQYTCALGGTTFTYND